MDALAAHRFGPVLEAGRWFGGLADPVRRALLDAAVVHRVGKGAWLFARGDAPDGLYSVVEGSIRIAATVGRSGRAVLLAVVEPPLWFGEISVVDGQPRTHDAIAEEPSVVVHVPGAALEAILAREPSLWRDLGALVAAKLRLSFHAMEDVVQPLARRLARRLVLSAERYGEWHDRTSRVVHLRQDQLATMLSTSRQTVNQLLKELDARALVRVAYGKIELLDLEGLRRVADPDGEGDDDGDRG
ncbi:MAG: Crp/Fnr family transcriptional regulator [Kofleriaceae bacterium]